MKNRSVLYSTAVAATLFAALLLFGCSGGSTKSSASSVPQTGTTKAAAQSSTTSSTSSTALKFPSGKKYKIGFASREILNDYNRDIIAGARKVIEAAGGTMVVTDGQTDPRKHNENIENLINSGVDGIIVSLGDPQQLAPVIADANAKHIPVVTNTIGSKPKGAVTDVDDDDAMMSAMMTRALFSAIDYKGDVYAFWVPGATVLEIRLGILKAMAKDYPLIKLHLEPVEHGPADAQAKMEAILHTHPEKGSIAGVWFAYDLLGAGADEAIRKAGRSEIKMASIDGDRVAFQMLFEKGSPFVATVAQDVPRLGELSAEYLIKAIDAQAKGTPISALHIPDMVAGDWFVATRHNGVKAAEMRWGSNVWQKIGMDKNKIISEFPQDQPVVKVTDIVP